jgi:sugar phosphate isomerase/epimerase
MKDAGLHCVSAHYNYEQFQTKFDQILASSKELNLSYMICSNPGPTSALEDWRRNAEQFNKFGEKVNAAGMKFGYHNQTMEFQELGGVVPYHELLRLTDPSKVTMEMDCGWAIVGGGNPFELLRRYPTRISMLHVKGFNLTRTPASSTHPPPIVELGQGSIDYRPIFQGASKTGHVKHCFVEQEDSNIPMMRALKIDADYMHKLNA